MKAQTFHRSEAITNKYFFILNSGWHRTATNRLACSTSKALDPAMTNKKRVRKNMDKEERNQLAINALNVSSFL